MKNFRQHFSFFYKKLLENENFAFARYSDGELYILQNKELKLDQGIIKIENNVQFGPYERPDFKHFDPTQHSFYQQKLVEAFKHRQPNYYKGISCKCCVGNENFDWQIKLHGGDDESLTWANLWVNGNYPLFMFYVFPLFYSKDCVFVGNKDADISKFPFFVKDFRVGYNAMINDYHMIDDIKNWISQNNVNNHTFLFSASTFSNLAIHELFKTFPNNSYIDIGTCLAPMMKMPTQRSYLQAFWNYTPNSDLERVCIWN